MGVAKMEYLNVYGPERKLLKTLGELARMECFAPESKESIHWPIEMRANEYAPLLTKAKGLLKDLEQPTLSQIFEEDADKYTIQEVSDYLEKFAGEVAEVSERKIQIENQLEMYQKSENIVRHMTDLDVNIEDLFSVGYLKVRVGRLPKESFVRLAYYTQKNFNFTSYYNFTVYDFDGEYYWGLYFAPVDKAKEIDEIFKSLYFERTRIPGFVQGKPEEALVAIRTEIQDLTEELKHLANPADIAVEKDLAIIRDMTSWLSYMTQLHEMKKYALVFNRTFYVSGFVPHEEVEQFKHKIEIMDDVHIQETDEKQELPEKPPVKLKNNWFSKPYEMFTTMYGLPSYHDIDPTPLVSIVYSVLFGLMFADLGQGIVVALFGYFYMYRMRKMPLGAILGRAGVFSAIFGALFGSVFGYEHALNPLWKATGLPHMPFAVMENINLILLASIGIGVVLVAVAIVMNIVSKLRCGKVGEAITSPNGVAGLIFYLSIVLLVLDMMMLHMGITSNMMYIVVLIVVPLLVMYLQEPIAQLINKEKVHIESVSDLLISGFFELFVTMLEYLSNTVSFLRVGGFVLAHAGMMTVVMTLANMAGAAAPVVVVLGNVFVIALEGLIVGIQALRLNYYEIFSRFFEADGIPFEPLKIQPDTVEL